METSENTATPSPTPAATARRSGRERRAPEKFRPEVTVAPKRKRGDDDDDDAENQHPIGEGDGEEDEAMSDGEDDEDNDSPDEEEERAARRQKKRNGASRARKPPAAKKPKTNGTAPTQSMSIPSRPKAAKKTARVVTGDRRDGDGVYGEVMSRNEIARENRFADAINSKLTFSDRATTPMTSRVDGTRNTGQTTRRLSRILSIAFYLLLAAMNR